MAEVNMDSKEEVNYDYDFVVIGGGSGGLAASKQAASLGARTACFDFVTPSHRGTTWGLGGTCVNVGCIPKKIMHYSSLMKQTFKDGSNLGWEFPQEPVHNWNNLVDSVGNYIASLNWKYRVSLRDGAVEYINAYAKFVDAHTLEYTDKKTQEVKRLTSKYILVCTGGRPNIPSEEEVPGAHLGVSSDDIFSWYTAPKKTLVVGASYIALECAGFLTKFGYDTTVMVRSILLRGFDQQCAEMIGSTMERLGTKFIRPAIPTKLEETPDGRILVTYKNMDTNEQRQEVYDTVLWAVGRNPCTKNIGLDKAGVMLSNKHKIIVDEQERSNVPSIFALGDVAENRPELTPTAIKAGRLLANRLFGGSSAVVDYKFVPTTVFTPYEYGCVGYTQEDAEKMLGAENVEVYLSGYGTTEISAAKRVDHADAEFIQPCFAKLVCDKTKGERVIGFHVISPEAGEITQGFALAVRLGAKKSDFDDLIGIHPTSAEEFTTLTITAASGQDINKAGGC